MIQIHYCSDQPKNEQKPKPGGLKVCLRAGFSQPPPSSLFQIHIQTIWVYFVQQLGWCWRSCWGCLARWEHCSPSSCFASAVKVKFLTWGSLTTFSDGNTCADVCLQCFSDPITRKTLKDVGGGARPRNINLPHLFADYFTEDLQLLDRHW